MQTSTLKADALKLLPTEVRYSILKYPNILKVIVIANYNQSLLLQLFLVFLAACTLDCHTDSSLPLYHWRHNFTCEEEIWTSCLQVKLRETWNSIKTVMYRKLLFHANKAIHKSTGFRERQGLFFHSIHSFQLLALETFFGKSFMNQV